MKKLITALSLLSVLLLAGCGEDEVPKLEDPHKPVVDGQAMTTSDFLEKYCQGEKAIVNETCTQVKSARAKDMTKSEAPRF